jgi:hemerythrin-like domain-containing protein
MTTLEVQTPTAAAIPVRTDAPDTSGYLAIHEAMRVANQQLLDGLANADVHDPKRAAAIARWFRGYSDELRTHHHIEDDIFFPRLLERVPEYAVYSGALAGDHLVLDQLIEDLRDALGRWAASTDSSPATRAVLAEVTDLAIELRDFLTEHLAIENADVLPMFEQHFSAAEYAELEQLAGRAISLRQALFTAPWYMATVDAETAQRTLREAPVALKVVYALTRRNYARLVETAFGSRS